jgi:type 1 glutamine amidotransferase
VRALVLCDDSWHPGSTVRRGLVALAEPGFEFDYVEDAGEWSAEEIARYRLVVLAKSNNVSSTDPRGWVTAGIARAFVGWVRRGNGLLVMHSGTAGYHDIPALRGLMGGAFVEHPPQCPVTVEPREGHPLAAASVPFTLVDEHYAMELDDAPAEVFLTTSSEHGRQPAGWTRTEGEGRVCVLTPGHNVEVWLHPSFQALLRNGLRWCGKVT